MTTFLANAFAARGYAIEILSHCYVKGQECFCRLNRGVVVGQLPETKLFSIRNRCFLQRKIADFMPDLIVYQDSYAPIEKNLFPVDKDIPVIVCEHNSPFVCYSEPNVFCGRFRSLVERVAFPVVRQLKYIRDRLRRRYLYDNCWRYVLLSERFFGEFRAVSRIDDSRKLRAIPNPAPELNDNEDAYEKRNDIVFTGTVHKRKGCDMLIEAWKSLSEKYKDWRLVIVGDGPYCATLKDRVVRNHISRVEFAGYQIDSSQWLKVAKIFAFPSRREGWGLVIAEAMVYGAVPVVMDSFSSVRDLILNNVNGIIVPAFDVAMFTQEIGRLIEDDALRLEMADAGRSAIGKYSGENVVDRWKDLFDELNWAAR